MTETIDDAETAYDLIRDFEVGDGRCETYTGFETSDHPRGVVRIFLHEDVEPEEYTTEVAAYTVEGRVSVPDTAYDLAWVGALQDDVRRPADSDWRQYEEDIERALAGGPEDTTLPEEYEQQFWNRDTAVEEGDVDEIVELFRTCFDDSYILPIDEELVDWFHADPVSSIIRDADGDVVSTTAAEPVRVMGTALGEIELVEISEVATQPEHGGQRLAAYNVQMMRNVLEQYDGDPIIYSQNTAAEPAMTRIATRNGGSFEGILRGHATVSNRFQDLVLTSYRW